MSIPRPSSGPIVSALDAIAAMPQRDPAMPGPDPLDDAMVAAMAGRPDAEPTGGDLDGFRRRMMRLGMETLG